MSNSAGSAAAERALSDAALKAAAGGLQCRLGKPDLGHQAFEPEAVPKMNKWNHGINLAANCEQFDSR
jgi:hypothetical protein